MRVDKNNFVTPEQLKAYEEIECDSCDNAHWSAPLKVIEWLDERAGKEVANG
jgi:hypothetical protein